MNIENKTDTIDERIENTKKLVGKFIEENDSLSSLGDYKDYIEKAINELKTTKEELEKETYMLLVVGGVKSGKSSLINALIGKESTIAKTGVETTIYPSIISSSKQDEIVVYEKRSGDEFKDDEHSDANAHDEEEAELIGVVINDIKGLSSAKNALVSKGIKKKIVDLNRDKIEKYVTSANREPNVLLINIRIQPKEDSIINNNTFIIDTPGIDGVIAGLSGTRRENESSKVDNNSKIEEELIKKSEYIIFMRSSLTPLPREGIKLFKESQYLTKRTIFFIHNKFTINPWRLTEDDSSEQIEKDRKIFSDFGIKPNPKIIDLGKANDAILNKPELKDKESYEQLLDDSKLKELEEDIKDAISRNGKQTHLDTQVSNLETNLENLQNDISGKYQEFQSEKKKTRDKVVDSFDKIINHLDEYIKNEEIFEEILKNSANNSGLNFTTTKKIFELNYGDFENINKNQLNEYTKEQLEEHKKVLSKKIIEKHNEILNQSIDIEKFNSFINNLNSLSSEDNALVTIETLLKTINETIDNKNPYLKFRLIKDDLNEIKIKEDKREVVRFVEPAPRKKDWKGFKVWDEDKYFTDAVNQMSKDAVNNFYINNEKEKSFFEKLFKKVEKYRNDMLDNKNKFYERELYAQKEKEYEKAKGFSEAFEDLKESIKNDE